MKRGNRQQGDNLLEDFIKESYSKLAKQYLLNIAHDKERVYVMDKEQAYSGKQILREVENKVREIQNNHSEIVLLASKNSFQWFTTYIASKVMNKSTLILSEDLDSQTLNKLKDVFPVNSTFIKNEFVRSRNLNEKSLNENFFKKEEVYDCIFTTGTTSAPKGVIVPERAYLHTANILIKKGNQSIDDKELLSMPFSHSFGLARLRTSILNNQSFFISDGLKDFPHTYKKFIDKELNAISLVPAAIEIIRNLLRKNSKRFGNSIKYFEIGSSALSMETRKWLKQNFKKSIIFHHYGMTEASRTFFIDRGNKDNLKLKKTYVGTVCSKDVSFKLLGGKRDQGEIAIRGPHLASGYFSLEEKIKYKKIGRWHNSNDLGEMLNGKLVLKGRTNTFLNVGGNKVNPEELEEIVEKLDYVDKAICFGAEDDIFGEVPVILLTFSSEIASEEEAVKQIKEKLKHLPSYKKPKIIKTTLELPTTSSGKKIRKIEYLSKFI